MIFQRKISSTFSHFSPLSTPSEPVLSLANGGIYGIQFRSTILTSNNSIPTFEVILFLKCASYICQTLFLSQTLCSPLREFKLKFDYAVYHCYRSYLDSWVQYAINSNVVVLHLAIDAHIYQIKGKAEMGEGNAPEEEEEKEDKDEVEEDDDFNHTSYHFADLIDSSVQVLKLHDCNLSLPNAAISMASLKSISLLRCLLITEEVGNLVSLCVNPEYLSIDCDCLSGLRNLQIQLPRLKELILSLLEDPRTGWSSIEICTLSLVSINFQFLFHGEVYFERYIIFGGSSCELSLHKLLALGLLEEPDDLTCWC